MRRPVGVKWVLLFFRCTSFFSPARVATVATLPSALFDERFFRSVQVGCSRFSRCCHLIVDLSFRLHEERGPGDLRSHRNSALWLLLFLPKKILTLCCRRHGYLVAVVQRLIHFSTHPQPMQQHGELSRRRNHGSLFPVLAATLRQFQTPAPQVAVRSKRTKNMVCTLH